MNETFDLNGISKYAIAGGNNEIANSNIFMNAFMVDSKSECESALPKLLLLFFNYVINAFA
jgi:hypothetical protein